MRNFGSVRLEGDGEVILPGVTRVMVTDQTYRVVFEKYDLFMGGVEVHLQDDGRTIKIVPLRKG